MIILFTNSKGGTGKSTLAIMFTQFLINYLLGQSRNCIMLVDADYRQKTINKLRMKDITKLQENSSDYQWNYEFYVIEGKDDNDNRNEAIAFNELKEVINIYYQKKDEGINTYMIVDLPGMLADIVISMFNIANIVIIPFEPTEFELAATTDYLNEIRQISLKRKDFLTDQKIFMLPNKVQKSFKYVSNSYASLEEQEQKWKTIIPSLTVTPAIPQSAHLKRMFSTAIITPQQAKLVSPSFSAINYCSVLCDVDT